MIFSLQMLNSQKNAIHTIVLLLAMTVLLALPAWLMAGALGVKLAVAMAVFSLLLTPRLPTHMVMKAYGARPVSFAHMPGIYQMTAELARRAGLDVMPSLYVQQSRLPNAFAVGTPKDPAICLSTGLIRMLNANEMAGILGHELTHIRNNDIQVMGISHLMLRLTGNLAFLGQVAFVLLLPAFLSQGIGINFLVLGLLAFAPFLSTLLHLALSRTREFEADQGSVRLTGNPRYLAGALAKLDRIYSRGRRLALKAGLGPGSLTLLRTHPPAQQRIQRLLGARMFQDVPEAGPRVLCPMAAGGSAPIVSEPPVIRFKSVRKKIKSCQGCLASINP